MGRRRRCPGRDRHRSGRVDRQAAGQGCSGRRRRRRAARPRPTVARRQPGARDHGGLGSKDARCLRHSTSHVLAQAVLDLFPGAKFAIGPAIENGFYYDFELPDGATFSEDDLERIEARHARDHRREPTVRPRRVRDRRRPRGVRRSAVQARDHRARRRERGVRRRPSSARTATPTASSISVAVRTCRPPDDSAASSSRRSRVRTGAATRPSRCCSGSTAPRGRATRR